MKQNNPDADAVAEARTFAVQAHGNQKYGNNPYSAHLDDVARTVVELGFTSVEHRVIAYLHDVLEDTATKAAEIERRFGASVREAVEQLTRNKDELGSEYLGRMGALAFAVKLADRISNIRAIGVSDAKEPERLLKKYQLELAVFMLPAARHGDAYTKAYRVLDNDIRAAADRLRTTDPADELSGFFFVGDRPVKAVKTPDGGLQVLAYDRDTGGFVPDMSYLTRITFGISDDVEIHKVSSAEFEAKVSDLNKSRRLA